MKVTKRHRVLSFLFLSILFKLLSFNIQRNIERNDLLILLRNLLLLPLLLVLFEGKETSWNLPIIGACFRNLTLSVLFVINER